jgi:hypothetical protein
MLGGNATFSAPEIMESIRIGAAEAAATLETAKWTPAEVALFIPADEYITASRGGTHAVHMGAYAHVALHRNLFPFCGVPMDSYELADIDNPRTPDYKVYIFPNLFTLSPKMREKIKAVVRRSGKTAIWFFAPGYYDGLDEGSVDRVVELTGVPVKYKDLGDKPPCRRLLEPTGSQVCERDGWRSVLMAEPPTPSVMRSALRDAGAHIWIDSDDVLTAGRGYVMLHASSDGEKKIRLPAESDVTEIFGASPPRKSVSMISETLKLGETRVWKIAPNGSL